MSLTAKVLCGDSDIETAQKYKEFIFKSSKFDGSSFGLSQNIPDTDITAMAISALSLCNDSQEIDNAINKAFCICLQYRKMMAVLLQILMSQKETAKVSLKL